MKKIGEGVEMRNWYLLGVRQTHYKDKTLVQILLTFLLHRHAASSCFSLSQDFK